MLASRRWRDWNPSAILQECSEHKLTKLTEPLPRPILSVLSVPTLRVSKTFGDMGPIPPCDPTEWRKPFAEWLESACVLNPRCFGGVSSQHNAFCEWEAGRGGVPCNRDTFELLLKESGFLVGEVAGLMLVSGLTFREDAEAVGLRPEAGGNSPSARS
jgi:hypothetical protein